MKYENIINLYIGDDFMEVKKVSKKAYVNREYCVACGRCEKECPLKAITIVKGIYSEVDLNKCVGCSKCSKICPASTIDIK